MKIAHINTKKKFPDKNQQKYSKDAYEDNDPCVFNIFNILCYGISLLFLLFIFKYIFF
jgi:hypothetical protein